LTATRAGANRRLIECSFAALSVAAIAALYCPNAATPEPETPRALRGDESSQSLPQVGAGVARAALEQQVDTFVHAITQIPGMSDDDSLVRWNTPICLLVAGLAADDLKAMSARLSQISASVGAPLARAPCQPNFVVVATSEPDQVLTAWQARDNRLFGDATPARISQFLDSARSRPVRVWYNINLGRKSGVHNGHFVPSNTRAESSAFVGNSIVDFFSIFVIIDTQRTEGTPREPLAAYVAMAGLTDIDPDADLGSAPSILRLFAAPAESPVSGLGLWDAAFLKALYRSNQTSRTQRFDITERMVHDISRSR
jgi:hypothetical protein